MSTSVEVVAVGARTPVGLVAQTSAAAVHAGVARLGEFPFIDPRGELVTVASDARLDRRPAAYTPGACAAQGALLLLHDDEALPAGMTERWYSSKGAPTSAPIAHIDNRISPTQIQVAKFAHGTTVPPCKTCELLVPLLLCVGGRTSCNHKI